MGLVAQHALSTFTSPVNNTSPIDANTVRGNDNTIKTAYNAHDADATIHMQSAAVASRPAFGNTGASFMATDTGAVYIYSDTGSAWVEVNYLHQATNGTVTITSTTTPQLTVAYDGSHSATFSVSSAGVLTVNATSTVTITPATTFSAVVTSTATGNDAIFGNISANTTTSWRLAINTSGTAKYIKIGADQTRNGFIQSPGTLDIYSSGGVVFNDALSGITTLGTSGAITTTLAVAGGNTITTGSADAQATLTITTHSQAGYGVFGVEKSTGGSILSGSTAHATIIATGNTTPIQFGVNNSLVLTLANGGAATFYGALSGITTITTSGGINGQTISSAAAFSGTLSTGARFSPSATADTAIVASSGTQSYCAQFTSTAANGTSISIQNSGVNKHYFGSWAHLIGSGSANDTVIGAASKFGIFTNNGTIAVTVNTDGSMKVAAGLSVASTTAPDNGIQFGTAAPSSLADGQIWYDGTNFKARTGGATKTFTIV